MSVSGGLFALAVVCAVPSEDAEMRARIACSVETDAACPTPMAIVIPSSFDSDAAALVRDIGLSTLGTPMSTPVKAEVPAYHAVDTVWLPGVHAVWQLQDNASQVELQSCAGPVAALFWDPALVDLAWLKVRLWQIPSLQPQRCAMAPQVCLTDC